MDEGNILIINNVQTDAWGIDERFQDAQGEWHDVSEDTRDALAKAMGDGLDDGPEPVVVVRTGTSRRLDGVAELALESGETLKAARTLPPNLPPGYHELRFKGGRTVPLIAAPRRCWLPRDLHIWGWALQLYALRSRESWGMGDLEDLRAFADWSGRELGAGVIMVNPLHTAAPGLP
jgi:4-alpha-glucanotransferase